MPPLFQRVFFLLPAMLGVGLAQQSARSGTMYDIPTKIHYEIFGRSVGSSSSFPHFNGLSYLAAQLQTQKRSLHSGLGYNTVAHGFGNQKMQTNGNSTLVDRIPFATDLFAPAIMKYPAATKGQIEAYMKALAKESEESEKEMQMITTQTALDNKTNGNMDSKPVSYVNVKLGGNQNVNYHYSSV